MSMKCRRIEREHRFRRNEILRPESTNLFQTNSKEMYLVNGE